MSLVLGVIPARYASTRFPGKALAPLGNKTMLERVWLAARGAKRIDRLLVATDDRELSSTDSTAIYISTEAELFQLTYDGSDEEYPCWSPDGTRIAYSSYQSGNQDIWCMEIRIIPTRIISRQSVSRCPPGRR